MEREDGSEKERKENRCRNGRRLVDRIPPDILVELKRQQRHTRER